VVLRGQEIVGFVTSVVRSPALGKVIGLAYAHADDAELGNTIRIKVDSGQVVEATVASPHFYDPDNTRQEM
jgi:sarcosine oxidase subunit alpha